jgi:hypothetical protein
METCEVNFD